MSKSQKLKNERVQIIPDVNGPYHGMHMIDAKNAFGLDHAEDTSIYLRFDGRAAIHDACRSACVLCVKALLLRDASTDVSLNLTMFPAWWDPAFHPWMYNYLSHSTQKNSQKYRSIWNVRPIHIAATHNCSECLEALVEDLSPKEIDATMILGHTTTFFRKRFTFNELHKYGLLGRCYSVYYRQSHIFWAIMNELTPLSISILFKLLKKGLFFPKQCG